MERSTLRYPKQTHPHAHPMFWDHMVADSLICLVANLKKKGFPPLRRRVRSGTPARKQVKTTNST